MSANTYFQNPKVLARLREDPLGPHIDLYAEQLITEGHCHQSGGRCLRVVGDFNRWLKRKRSGINGIDEIAVERYLSFRQRYRHPFMSDRPALNRLLAVLRNAGLISEPTTKFLDPLAQIEHDFEHFLLLERGLCQASVVRHRTPLRKFIQEHCSQGPASFSALTAADIIGFVERHAHEQSPRSAQSMCWTLRAFTRYLQFCGYIVSDLAASIPSVRTWRFTAIPDRLSSEQVQQTLDACDRRSPIGQIDEGIMCVSD